MYEAKDTFWAFRYRGQQIQGCWNRSRNQEEIQTSVTGARLLKSVHAAKLAITRHQRKVAT